MWKPYVGLNDDQIKQIQRAYPTLKTIQAITKVPWQLLAAIWYRESFSVTPPSTPGGCWQFDPVPPESELKEWLAKYTNLDPIDQEAYLHLGMDDFQAGGVFAACLLQEKVAGQLNVPSQDFIVQQAAWGYNGRVGDGPMDSPYVANGYDEAHFPMKLRGTEPDGHGGRVHIDIEDHRPGAYTVYKQLQNLFP